MKTRIKHVIYLAPAVVLLLIWIATAPSLISQYRPAVVVACAVVTGIVIAWCITLFAHALQRDRL